jgi:hypothetical protein
MRFRGGVRRWVHTTLGAFTFTLHKTLHVNTGEYRGCVVLTAPDGDTLAANYELIQGNSASEQRFRFQW